MPTPRKFTFVCPQCGDGEKTYSFWMEYQGERPHGGMVDMIELLDQTCECELDDEVAYDATYNAWLQASPPDPDDLWT